jgi:hypothetical protein
MTFQGVKYHLSTTLPRARRAELARILREHHAIRADSVFNATYIITNSEVFEGSRDIDTEKVSIVSVSSFLYHLRALFICKQDLWVEHSIASQKIQQSVSFSFLRAHPPYCHLERATTPFLRPNYSLESLHVQPTSVCALPVQSASH